MLKFALEVIVSNTDANRFPVQNEHTIDNDLCSRSLLPKSFTRSNACHLHSACDTFESKICEIFLNEVFGTILLRSQISFIISEWCTLRWPVIVRTELHSQRQKHREPYHKIEDKNPGKIVKFGTTTPRFWLSCQNHKRRIERSRRMCCGCYYKRETP